MSLYNISTVNGIMKARTSTIWITFDKPGVHCYPNAPEAVNYLRQLHRHLFKFKVGITVHHDDREIEFHMFRNQIVSWYDEASLFLDHMSCEMIADGLAQRIMSTYNCNDRTVVVEVSEDGECGAVISYGPAQ